jgi:hypothetical protein
MAAGKLSCTCSIVATLAIPTVDAALSSAGIHGGESIMAKGQIRASKEKKKPKADKKAKTTTMSAYKAAQQQAKKGS